MSTDALVTDSGQGASKLQRNHAVTSEVVTRGSFTGMNPEWTANLCTNPDALNPVWYRAVIHKKGPIKITLIGPEFPVFKKEAYFFSSRLFLIKA